MQRRFSFLVFACVAAAIMPAALAQNIYSCVDAKGRRLTADRPIPECNDREQREMSPSGRLVRNIGPSMSTNERTAQEEKARLEAEERGKQFEEKRRSRVLLTRYPNQAAHDKERATQLANVDTVIAPASRRAAELSIQRKKLESDAAREPAKFKRQLEELDQQLAGQKRFIADQEGEKQRINLRFDEERARLVPLWAQH